MAKLRDSNKDKRKSNHVIKEQVAREATCMLEDCCNPISIYEGPGSNILCRTHQLDCVEYGGMGKPERPHTFYRNWICEDCGYDPRVDPDFANVEEFDGEFHRLSCMRAMMEGDHGVTQSEGRQDETLLVHTEENITTRCCMCHRKKTMKNKDYLGRKKVLTT
jgi:hypothetical protein